MCLALLLAAFLALGHASPEPSCAPDLFDDVLGAYEGTRVSVEVAACQGQVCLRLEGPDTKWFGVGLSNTDGLMTNKYALVVHNASGWQLTERRLGSHDAGTELISTFSWVEQEVDLGRRIVMAQRPRQGATSSYYTFGSASGPVTVLWAVGSGSAYALHAHHGTAALTLSTPDVADGQACQHDNDCASWWCVAGTCGDTALPLDASCLGACDCESGICVEGACANELLPDGERCTAAESCLSGHCVEATCADGLLVDGEGCTAAESCLSGHCVDDVCCVTACDRACEGCAVARTGLADGTCSTLTASVAEAAVCRVADGPCDVLETCAEGSPTCPDDAVLGTGEVCAAGTCVGDVELPTAFCDGAGKACPEPAELACAPYTCEGSACREHCATDDHCVAPAVCDEGACEGAGSPQGAPCATDDACASGFCTDGVCCSSACDGACEACDEADAAGTCVAVTGAPRGDRPACATDGTACGGTCDGVERTACTYPGAETPCGEPSCDTGASAPTCDAAGACLPADEVVCADGCGCSGADPASGALLPLLALLAAPRRSRRRSPAAQSSQQ